MRAGIALGPIAKEVSQMSFPGSGFAVTGQPRHDEPIAERVASDLVSFIHRLCLRYGLFHGSLSAKLRANKVVSIRVTQGSRWDLGRRKTAPSPDEAAGIADTASASLDREIVRDRLWQRLSRLLPPLGIRFLNIKIKLEAGQIVEIRVTPKFRPPELGDFAKLVTRLSPPGTTRCTRGKNWHRVTRRPRPLTRHGCNERR
jgi:hypothetical protein